MRIAWWLVGMMALAGCGSDEPSGSSGGSGGEATTSGGGSGGMGTGGGGLGGAAPVACPAGTKDGPAQAVDGELTPMGRDYNVRPPPGYDPTIAHPLLAVYPGAGGDADAMEGFTGLTADAHARGYIVAYMSHPGSLSDPGVIEDMGQMPALIATRWCVDEAAVFYTGHSDGGSVATILPLLDVTPRAAAIAPSAAGINSAYVNASSCPGFPVPAMVIHSTGDTLFPVPDFGLAAADFWAGCGGCGELGMPGPDSCAAYAACSGANVAYCETTGGHATWYGLNAAMLDFFDAAVER
jgi:polyhydroxybutyrate depolymerase